MRASAHILVQRYLDGDLSGDELREFLEDVSHNPELASMLEQEVHLEIAIIKDAYSIEPPANLRASVLSSLPVESTTRVAGNSNRIGAGLAVGILFFLASLVGVGTDSTRFVAATLPVSASPAAQSEQTLLAPSPRPSADRHSSVLHTPSSAEAVGDRVIPDVETSEPPLPVEGQVKMRWYGMREQPNAMVRDLRISSDILPLPGLFTGLIATTTISIRYELNLLEGSQVFVEAGGLKQSRTSTVYVNDVAASTIASGFTPYLSIGVSGTVVDLDMLGRSIEGAASIGVTSAGPIAMVDLSAPLFDFGTGTLDVGLRTSALFDVGSGQRVHVNAAPFIRVDMSLR
jgi:hypothetical protein